MRVSFCILNYNREKELLSSLQKTYGLMAGRDDFEVIVVDNASSDNSVASVKQAFPNVLLIERSVNIGVAGWNDAFERAASPYLIVLDDDSNVEDGVDEALDYLDEHPEVGILALNVSGGAFPTDYLKDRQDYIGFIGCGAIIRKTVYRQIGGFAEWLFIYTHEYEYGIRCLAAGYKIRFFENCHVTHRTSSLNRTSKRLKIFSVRNELAIVYKNFSTDRWKYLNRILLNNMKYVRRGGLQGLLYVIEGYIRFLKFRKTLEPTPVSKNIQDAFIYNFWSTKPVFYDKFKSRYSTHKYLK